MIANIFNSFFTTVGANLSSKIKAPTNKTFTDYHRRLNTLNFNFHVTNEECVSQIITDLAPKTSLDLMEYHQNY